MDKDKLIIIIATATAIALILPLSSETTIIDQTPARETLSGQWDTQVSLTHIGTSYVDVYTNANSLGHGILVDTSDMSTVNAQIIWIKQSNDTGTQQCKFVDVTNSSNVLLTSATLLSGSNIAGDLSIPLDLQNTAKTYKIQCVSSAGLDSPTFIGARLFLKP